MKSRRALVALVASGQSTRDAALQLGYRLPTARCLVSRARARGELPRPESKKKPYNAWSPRELALLREQYPTVSAREIAQQLGRSIESVRTRAYLIGVKQVHRYRSTRRIMLPSSVIAEIYRRADAAGVTPSDYVSTLIGIA